MVEGSLINLIILFFILIITTSCTKRLCLDSSININYLELIQRAELAIVDGNLYKSIKYYNLAVEQNKQAHVDDLFNAFQVSRLINNEEYIFYYAKRLGKCGLCIEFFDRYGELKRDSIKYYELKATCLSNNINTRYSLEINQILNDDQAVRNGGEIEYSYLRYIDSVNYCKLKLLISEYGPPYFEQIKIKCTPNFSGFWAASFEIPIRHFSRQKFNGLDSLISIFLNNNLIKPVEYCWFDQLFSFEKSDNTFFSALKYYAHPIVLLDNDMDKLYTYNISNTKKREVNKLRKHIGMHSLENQIKILIFTFKNRKNENFNFRLDQQMDLIPYQKTYIEKSILSEIKL